MLCLVVAALLGSLIEPGAVPYQPKSLPAGSRLERVAQVGGTTPAMVLDGTDALIAEGYSLVRVPLLGVQAFEPVERMLLTSDAVVDLVQTSKAIYGLTPQQILILSPDGHDIQSVLDGGGEKFTIFEDLLAVSSRQAGVRLFQIQADGALIYLSQIATPTVAVEALFLNRALLGVVDNLAGLRLIDIQNPSQPLIKSLVLEAAPAENAAAFDRWVYVAGEHHVIIIDAFDPSAPRIVGTYAPAHDIRDQVWVGARFVMADGGDGLKVYELNAAGELGYINSQMRIPSYEVAYDDTAQLLLAAQSDGLQLYDATRLPAFEPLGFVPLWSSPQAIVPVPGWSLALVTLGAGGLAVIDLRDPQRPTVRAALPFSGGVQHVAFDPRIPFLAYITLDDGKLEVLNFDPNVPETTGLIHTIPLSGQPGQIALNSDLKIMAIAQGRAGVSFYSLADSPAYPQWIADYPAQSETPGIVQVASVDPNRWFVLDGDWLKHLVLVGDQIYEIGRAQIQGHDLLLGNGFVVVSGGNQITYFSLGDSRLHTPTKVEFPQQITDITALLDQVVLTSEMPRLTILDVLDRTAPREQRILDLPSSADRLWVYGEDLFIRQQSTPGINHIRFPLLLASLPEVQPTLVGTYTPPAAQRWLPAAPEWSVLLADLFEIQPTGAPLTGVKVGNDYILLGENSIPYRLSQTGRIVSTNPSTSGRALAFDGVVVWLLQESSRVIALDAQTLLPTVPRREVTLQHHATALTYANGHLWVGTEDGRVFSLRTPVGDTQPLESLINSELADLGGKVHAIQSSIAKPNELLLAADKGGVWRVDISQPDSIRVIAHYRHTGNAFAAEIDPSGQWLAVAGGLCGLQVMEAEKPYAPPYAFGQPITVTDLGFVKEGIVALEGGYPSLYHFHPENPLDPVVTASNPEPLHEVVVAQPIDVLRWQPMPDPCRPVQFEVWIDGGYAGTTSQSEWTLGRPISRDTTWQIVTIDPYGKRIAGPEWRILFPIEGWANRPNPLPATAGTAPSQSQDELPWWLVGLIFMVLGGLGLLSLLRRFVFPLLPTRG